MRLLRKCFRSVWTKPWKQLPLLRSSAPSEHSRVGNALYTTAPREEDPSSPPAGAGGPPWRVMFFGTDDFALRHLEVLVGREELVQRLEVTIPVTKCPVGQFAAERGLTTHHWPVTVSKATFDVGIIVSFGHLIPATIIDAFPHGILNAHPSLLPLWRGASPIIHSLLAGDAESAVTVMDISATKFDVGPVLLQRRFPIPPDCGVLQLKEIAGRVGAEALLHCLQHLTTIERTQQEGPVSYAKKLRPNCGLVNWEKQTPSDVDRQFRALSAILQFRIRTRWKGLHVRLEDMVPPRQLTEPETRQYLDTFSDAAPGFPVFLRKSNVLCIKCKNGWVGFKKIVIRRPMSAGDFQNGYLSKPENQGVCFDSQENGLDRYWGS